MILNSLPGIKTCWKINRNESDWLLFQTSSCWKLRFIVHSKPVKKEYIIVFLSFKKVYVYLHRICSCNITQKAHLTLKGFNIWRKKVVINISLVEHLYMKQGFQKIFSVLVMKVTWTRGKSQTIAITSHSIIIRTSLSAFENLLNDYKAIFEE